MKRLLCGIVLAVALAGAAQAQYIEKGDREVQVSAALFTVSGLTALNLTGVYGYYTTDQWELGGGPSITYLSTDFFSDTTVGFRAFTRYNFTAHGTSVPYVSGQWYQGDISPDDPVSFTDLSYLQAGAGVKVFLNERVAYDISGNLGFSLGNSEVAFTAVAGLSALF